MELSAMQISDKRREELEKIRLESPVYVATIEAIATDPASLVRSASGKCGCAWAGHGIYQL